MQAQRQGPQPRSTWPASPSEARSEGPPGMGVHDIGPAAQICPSVPNRSQRSGLRVVLAYGILCLCHAAWLGVWPMLRSPLPSCARLLRFTCPFPTCLALLMPTPAPNPA